MLTRLEIDGFKNLRNLALDFGPFTCIAGPNSVGKSNVFDAIQLLSLLADHSIMEAALKVRGSHPETSDFRELFSADGTSRASSFTLTAEMIVDQLVEDDFGRPAEATSTFLRYELRIGYEPPSAKRGLLGRLVLESEKLDYITQGDAHEHLGFPHSASRFRQAAVINKRKAQSGFISVHEASDGQTEIVVHQDGGSRGPGQRAAAGSAPRTIVGTSNTSATPTILAARREMQRWRLLALEPSAMRRPDRFQADPSITVNGGHLPAALYRLSHSRGGASRDVWAEVANRLARLVPVISINVVSDEARQLLTLEVEERGGVALPASSLSDGTLRFLALAVMSVDPEARGLICIEEPENGIHPAKMPAMVELLQDLVVDVEKEPGDDNPFRQVIVATHSPTFVKLQRKEDLLFAVQAKIRANSEGGVETLRCLPLESTWRADKSGRTVGLGTILAYLTEPPGRQLTLPKLESAEPAA